MNPTPDSPPAAVEVAPAQARPRGAMPLLRERFKDLIAEYGPILFVVHFGIFGLVLTGFAIAIRMGLAVDGAAGTAGTLGAAYVLTQLTKPVRFGATIVLTPLIGALLRRFRKVPEVRPEMVAETVDAPVSASGRQR